MTILNLPNNANDANPQLQRENLRLVQGSASTNQVQVPLVQHHLLQPPRAGLTQFQQFQRRSRQFRVDSEPLKMGKRTVGPQRLPGFVYSRAGLLTMYARFGERTVELCLGIFDVYIFQNWGT